MINYIKNNFLLLTLVALIFINGIITYNHIKYLNNQNLLLRERIIKLTSSAERLLRLLDVSIIDKTLAQKKVDAPHITPADNDNIIIR